MRFFAKRVAWGLATLFGASVIAFILMRVVPGDPARQAAGELSSQAAVQAEAHSMGLDRPLPVQYFRFVKGFFTGNWGFAYSMGIPARQAITSHLMATVELAFYAFVIAAVISLVLAVLAAYTRNRLVDGTIRALSSVGMATPQFYLALVALVLFTQRLHLLSGPEGRLSPNLSPPPHVTGFYTIDALLNGNLTVFGSAVSHLLLPCLVMSVVPTSFLMRLLRANLLETSRDHYMLVLTAKGTSRLSAYLRHALPNAALPTITAGGLILAEMLVGSVLTEKAFSWPGVGELVVSAVGAKDFSVVQSFVMLSAFAYVLVNTVVDLLYGVIDPRVRSMA